MNFKFYKCESDNNYVDKKLTEISTGTEQVTEQFALNSPFTYLRNDNLSNVGFTGVSADELQSYWNGDPGIGNCMYYTTKVDLTDIDTITFNVVTGTCYGLGDQVYDITWALQIGFQRDVPTIDVIQINDPAWLIAKDFPNSNTDYGEQTFDVSNLTGEAYFCFYCHGMNTTITDMIFNKTIHNYGSVSVIYKENVDEGNITLELQNSGEIKNATYAYCLDNGYYYYLDKPTYSAQRIYFKGRTDLLMTKKNEIYNLGCIINRQENKFNTYLKDSEVSLYANRKVNTIKFPYGFSDDDQLILATI